MSDRRTDDSNVYSRPQKNRKFISHSKMIRNAYDGNGLLLLPAGAVVDETREVDRLKQEDVQFSPHKSVCASTSASRSRLASKNPSDASQSPKAVLEDLHKRTEEARALRDESTVAVASLFKKALSEGVDFEEVQHVVSPMVTAIVNDPRTMLSLVNLKNADAYTFTHSIDVATLTIALAVKSDNSDRLEETAIAAIMHDVGKTSTPDGILKKPGPLNSQELSVMRQHPVVGASILMQSGGFSPWIINAVIDHHESFEGNGYPRSRKGTEIGVPARMISISDVYDALTTDRPYRAALTSKVAIEIMMDKMRESFDPSLLDTFVSIVGYYPAGSIVELTGGVEAQVLMVDPNDMTRPAIVEVIGGLGDPEAPESFIVDLRVQKAVSVRTKGDEPTLQELDSLITHEFRSFSAVA